MRMRTVFAQNAPVALRITSAWMRKVQCEKTGANRLTDPPPKRRPTRPCQSRARAPQAVRALETRAMPRPGGARDHPPHGPGRAGAGHRPRDPGDRTGTADRSCSWEMGRPLQRPASGARSPPGPPQRPTLGPVPQICLNARRLPPVSEPPLRRPIRRSSDPRGTDRARTDRRPDRSPWRSAPRSPNPIRGSP